MSFALVFCDVDSTLIKNEVIDLLAGYAGQSERVSEITRRAMAGEIDFKTALIERVSLLAGLEVSAIKRVAADIEFSPGALELYEYCRANSIAFGAVTGGFKEVLEQIPLFRELDYFAANSLEISQDRLTGKIQGPIVDRKAKAQHLIRFAAENHRSASDCLAIGDGANDIEMIRAAGLGISFRGKPALNDVADAQINDSLAEIIPLFLTKR